MKSSKSSPSASLGAVASADLPAELSSDPMGATLESMSFNCFHGHVLNSHDFSITCPEFLDHRFFMICRKRSDGGQIHQHNKLSCYNVFAAAYSEDGAFKS